MKRILLFTSLFTVITATASAQVTFGLKAGPMLTRTYFNVGDTTTGFNDARISFVAGAFVGIPLVKKLSLQAEVLYAAKGDANYDQNYIYLPLMLRYALLPKLNVEAGAEVGYFLGYISTAINNPRFTDFDLGINAGVNYELLDKLCVGLRYNLGVMDVFAFQAQIDPDTRFEPIGKNHSLQLTVGYRLR
jgi:hypothetical protein